jgi:hypothetical protein
MTDTNGTKPAREQPSASERRWAVVRIVLGLGQVMAATATLCFLLLTGASVLTTIGVAVAGSLFCLSKWLFRSPAP